MRKLKQEVLNKMDEELLLEELKYINNVTLHNDKTTLSLILGSISINMLIYRFFTGTSEIFIWFKTNIDLVTFISVICIFLINLFLTKYFNTYKDDIINRLIKKKYKVNDKYNKKNRAQGTKEQGSVATLSKRSITRPSTNRIPCW